MFKLSLHKPASPFSLKKIVLLVVIVIICIACAAGGAYAGIKGKLPFLSKPAEQATKEQVAALVVEVGKLIVLPEGEEPTLATVTDKTKLANQAFFAHAENGDQVLLFVQAKKAYLYRPSTKKLVDVSVLSLTDGDGTNTAKVESPTVTATVAPKPTVSATPLATTSATEQRYTVAIYNGTTTEGATVTIADKLKTAPVKAAVLVRSKAAKTDYAKTIVVDMTGKNADAAQKLAEFLKGEVGPLPAGELTPSTDLDVIVGTSSLE